MEDATTAFGSALERVPKHPMARLGLAMIERRASASTSVNLPPKEGPTPIEEVLAIAALHVFLGSHARAAQLVDQALLAAPPSNAAWLLPIEPLLNVSAAPLVWESALTRLSARTT